MEGTTGNSRAQAKINSSQLPAVSGQQLLLNSWQPAASSGLPAASSF